MQTAEYTAEALSVKLTSSALSAGCDMPGNWGSFA
jgi:hypothetical protein